MSVRACRCCFSDYESKESIATTTKIWPLPLLCHCLVCVIEWMGVMHSQQCHSVCGNNDMLSVYQLSPLHRNSTMITIMCGIQGIYTDKCFGIHSFPLSPSFLHSLSSSRFPLFPFLFQLFCLLFKSLLCAVLHLSILFLPSRLSSLSPFTVRQTPSKTSLRHCEENTIHISIHRTIIQF